MQEFVANLQMIELDAVGITWLLFALVFFVRKSPPKTKEKVRDQRSVIGMILQFLGYVIVRLGLRVPGTGFLQLETTGEISAALVAFGILAASIYLTYAAVKTLGKQWSLAARLVQGHELITTGPYGFMRHPIYTAMFGMLVGTAIAISQWPELLIASVIFLAGTFLRIHAEEQLLMAAFGDDYRKYAGRVPALIPGWPTVQHSR